MYTIGRLAKACDVGVETVRYYHRKGLLEVPDSGGGVRRYDQDDLRRLRFIRKAQAAGFKLKEIQELLALDSGKDHQRAREIARARIAELDETITQLQQARKNLTKLADMCAHSDDEPCPILEAFEV